MRMPGTRKKNKGDCGLHSCTPVEKPGQAQAPTWPAAQLGLEEAGPEGSTCGQRREEGAWLLGGLRLEQEPLAAHQNSSMECSLAAGMGFLFRTCQGTAGAEENSVLARRPWLPLQ